ncbi:MAG: immunoglobulin domain-containing protein, partial [Verrucomicrobia bacterium]|nr:immunoglobulin domain-containing protein [Verrucomicrobiota bacterium]
MKTTKQITILVCNLLLASLATAQAQAPVITTPPQDQYVPIGYGSNATFTVTVSNAPPLAYQWQKDGANLANATNATLVIPNAGTNDVGEYRVVVSNGDGSVTSSPPAVLTVYTSLAISTLAGQAGSSGSADGTNGTARFYNPNGVAVDTNGNIYVADKGNFTIRRITPEGTVTTLAGRAGTSGSTDGLGTNALFASPTRLAVDSAGNLWVADLLSIRKMTPAGEVSTVAGQACTGIDVDDAGNVYVADHWSHIIRKMTPDGTVTTLAGRAGVPGSIDGVGTNALFYFPSDVAVDSNGNVYVADSENYTIRKISPDGTVLTVAGQAGQNGFTDGRAPNARFGGVWVEFQEVGPTGVTVDR